MAVKIRLARKGRKNRPYYSIVIADARAPRDGKNLGKIGTYDPTQNPAPIQLDIETTLDWLNKGAQPTPTVRHILSSQGILLKRHLQIGIDKGIITQDIADQRFNAWEKIARKKKRRPYQPHTTSHTKKEQQA